MDLFEFDFFRDWELEQPCHVESERSALKRKEWERRNQEVHQDEDLFSTGFNLFGEPYKTNKGDALANRVQNTLGSYEEMKDLLTSQSNQSHLVGIPKGGNASNNNSQNPTNTNTERPTTEQQNTNPTTQPPMTAAQKKSRGIHGQSAQGGGLVVGLGSGVGRGRMGLTEEQQRQEELFSSIKDELGLKGDSSPASSSSSSTSSSSAGRRHAAKTLPLTDGGNFRSSTLDGGHFKSSSIANENSGHFKTSPFENDMSPPLASTSLLATPTAGLTTPVNSIATPTSSLATPTFPPGGLSGKPMAVQQKPTAYVRPMDGQDQAPSDSPQLKPPLVAAEGYNSTQTFGGNTGNVKNKLPKLNLGHTGEVNLQNDSSCVEEILREMTHSWPPPLTAIHTPVKAEQTKFPILNKDSQHVSSGYSAQQKRCSVSANTKPSSKPAPAAPQKSMLEDDLKISSDEEEQEQQASEKPKVRNTALSGGSGSSSESESSSESDTDESESSSSDSEYNRQTNTPEPDPPSSNKWQLDSWLNKVQPQTKAPAPPQQENHGEPITQEGPETFSPETEAPTAGTAVKSKPCGASTTIQAVSTAEHKENRAAFCPSREKSKSRLSQKGSGEGQRSKVRSPGVMSGSEVTTPRRTTTGKKQPRRPERSNSGEDQNQVYTRTNTHSSSPVSREKDLLPPRSQEHLTPTKPPRSRPPGGKTAPRKEPKTTANGHATATANTANANTATLQQTPVPPSASANQDKRKHRGASSKITPKSREFIETESSSSSSECPSDPEDATSVKIPPTHTPQASTRPNHLHATSVSSTTAFGGKGLRLKDNNNNNTAIANSSISGSISTNNANGSSSLSISNISGPFGNSVPDPGGKILDAMSPPMPMDIPLSPLSRDYQEIQSLWVKIDLSLLSRVPRKRSRDGTERFGVNDKQKHEDWQGSGIRERQKLVKVERQDEDDTRLNGRGDNGTALEQNRGRVDRGENSSKHRKQATGVVTEKHSSSKSKRKHKSDHSESISHSKKLRLDKDCSLLPPCISPIHPHKTNDSFSRKQCTPRDEKLLPPLLSPLLSPLSEEPPRKPTVNLETVPPLNTTITSSMSSSSGPNSTHRHRRGEAKSGQHVRGTGEVEVHSDKSCVDGYHGNGQSDTEVWSENLIEQCETRPRLAFTDTVHSADYYMQEAKRLKHKADALMDKFGKAVNYADGALSFIECGNAMERDPLEAKSPYTMYSETVELIRYAMRLKNFTSHSASISEKKLAVLCNRCLSLLYLRMFHLKKDHAVKYSRSLMDYFKNSAKSSHQAPSPWRTNGKVNGAPSPLSLCPSPVSSSSSSGTGSGSGLGLGSNSSGGSVSIPQRIHHMAASHVNITNNLLRSYETWESADRLASDCTEFFEALDSVLSPLTQQSSMSELVRYVRQGLHWLRIEAHLLL